MEYYIYVTNRCNLNCSYCSVLFDTQKFGIPLEPNFSLDSLEKFIVNTQNKFKDSVADIYFFGGEPTLNYDLIADIIKQMKGNLGFKVNFILHTNGLLVPQASDFILENLDLALISINYEKQFSNGVLTPYWGKIINSIQILKEVNNVPLIGRLTITDKTSIYNECALLGNFFDYIYWQIDNCAQINNFDMFQSNYTYEIELLFKYWMSFLKEGVFLNYVPFVSAIKNFINKSSVPSKFYCGYGSSMIFVQTDGNCYACCDSVDSKIHIIGDIYKGVCFPEIDLKSTLCNECEYINICGGRCGRMHIEFTSDRINQYCSLNKFMFQMIENTLPEIKALISYFPDYINKINDPMLSYTEFTA